MGFTVYVELLLFQSYLILLRHLCICLKVKCSVVQITVTLASQEYFNDANFCVSMYDLLFVVSTFNHWIMISQCGSGFQE